MAGRRYIDISGQTFNSLKVMHKAPSGHRIMWVCECLECGKICVVRGDYLKAGKIKSCGCMAKGKPAGEMSEEGMRSGADSLDRLDRFITEDADPYQNLANAIVAVAADDYRTALKDDNQKLKGSLEKFFRSDWYKVLTSVDGNNLIRLLQREHSESLCAVNI